MLSSTSSAAIFLCFVTSVSCFAPKPPHAVDSTATWALSTIREESRWTRSTLRPYRFHQALRCSVPRDEGRNGLHSSGLCPEACFARGLVRDSEQLRKRSSWRFSRQGSGKHGLYAMTGSGSRTDEPQASKRRRVLASGSLRAGKHSLGEEEAHTDIHTLRTGEDEADVSKGWGYWKYRVLLLGVALLWGTNFPAVKFVERHGEISDATAAFLRFAMAAGASLPFADLREKEVLLSGMEIGVWVSLGYVTQAIGLQTSDASVCAFLCSLTVVIVPLLDAVTGKGIKRVTVAASALALLGTGFLELGDAHASLNDLWCVAQAIGFGVAFTRIEHYMTKFPGKSLQLSIGQLISVAGLTGLWCAYTTRGHIPDVSFLKDPSIAGALAYTGLVTTSLAIWLETICLEKVPAAEMSVIFSTEPLWATVVSRFLLKETMGPNAIVGASVILLACLVAQSEQIMQLVGRGDGKDTDNGESLVASDSHKDAGHAPHEKDENEDLGRLPVFDEVDPPAGSELESLADTPLVEDYTLRSEIYMVERSPAAKREGGCDLREKDAPAVPAGFRDPVGPV